MKYLRYLLIILMIIPLQTILVENMEIGRIKPDLGFIIIYFIGIFYGEVEGIVMGMIIGVFFDIFSGGYWGVNIFGKSAVGFLAGYMSRHILNISFYLNLLFMFLMSLIEGLMAISLLLFISNHVNLLEMIASIVIPQAFYNSVIGLILFYIFIRKKFKSSMRNIPQSA